MSWSGALSQGDGRLSLSVRLLSCSKAIIMLNSFIVYGVALWLRFADVTFS